MTNKKENYQLAIYKFNTVVDLNELSNKLSAKMNGFKEEVNNNIINVDQNTKILFFSFLNKNPGNDIKWFQKWNSFFNINNHLRASSSTGHGAIVIDLLDVKEQYLLTFGRAYSLLKEYIVPNYGIKVAGKLFDGKSIDSVSSKFFSLTKNKSIVSYAQGASYDFEEGEAADLLKAEISKHNDQDGNRYIEKLLGYVKPLATISYTNIKLTISKDNIVLDDLVTVIRLLSNIEKAYSIRFVIPQMTPVDKTIRENLNKELWNHIKSKDKSIIFSVPFFNKNSEDYYIFLDSIDSVTLKYYKASKTYENFCMDDLFSFIEAYPNITSLSPIRCIVTNNQTEREEPNLFKWLEAQIDYDGTTYALYDGKWYSFNANYLERVNQRIEEIEKEANTIFVDSNFSVDSDIVDQFCIENEQDIIKLFSPNSTSTLSSIYKEFKYNYYISRKKNLNLFDRCISGSIELCDLSDPNQAFIHCKIGDTANLEECLRQSMIGLTYFTQNKKEMEQFENKEGKLLTSPKYIKILYLLESDIGEEFKISNTHSLKCKLTFLKWYNYCHSMKYTPQLVVAQYKKNS